MDVNIIYPLSKKEVLSFKPRKGYGVIYRYDFPSLVDKYPTPSYIGLTKQHVSKRHSQHFSATKTNNVFNNTLTTHEFNINILEMCEIDRLNDCERYWISAINSLYPNGLNYDEGGKRMEMSDATRKKLSSSLKTIFNEDKYRMMRSDVAKKQWDDPEMREKMIRGMRENKHPRDESYMVKVRSPLVQMSLDGEFIAFYPSISSASEKTGIAREQIRDTIHGKQKSCKGYKFISVELGER